MRPKYEKTNNEIETRATQILEWFEGKDISHLDGKTEIIDICYYWDLGKAVKHSIVALQNRVKFTAYALHDIEFLEYIKTEMEGGRL